MARILLLQAVVILPEAQLPIVTETAHLTLASKSNEMSFSRSLQTTKPLKFTDEYQ